MNKSLTLLLLCTLNFTPIYAAVPDGGPRAVRYATQGLEASEALTRLKIKYRFLSTSVVNEPLSLAAQTAAWRYAVDKGAGTWLKQTYATVGASTLLTDEQVSAITRGETPLTSLTAAQKDYFFQTALPTELLEGSAIPTVQITQAALTHYRSALVTGTDAASQLTSIFNLSLLGDVQDAPLILQAAQGFSPEYDGIAIRSLNNLGAYPQLQSLAKQRAKAWEMSEAWGQFSLYVENETLPITLPDNPPQTDYYYLKWDAQLERKLAAKQPYNLFNWSAQNDVTQYMLALRQTVQEKISQSHLEQQVQAQLHSATSPADLISERVAARGRKILAEQKAFQQIHQRNPNPHSEDPQEKTLAIWVNRYTTIYNNEFSQKIRETFDKFRRRAPRQTPKELLEKQLAFQQEHHRNPKQESLDPQERALALAISTCLHNHRLSPIGKQMRENFEKFRDHKQTLSLQEVLRKQESFQRKHGRNPDVNSSNKREARLAKAIEKRKERNSDTPEGEKIRKNFDKFRKVAPFQTPEELLAKQEAFQTANQRNPSTSSADKEEHKLAKDIEMFLIRHKDSEIGKKIRDNWENFRPDHPRTPQELLARQEAFHQAHQRNPKVATLDKQERSLAIAISTYRHNHPDTEVGKQLQNNFDTYRMRTPHPYNKHSTKQVYEEFAQYVLDNQSYPHSASPLYKQIYYKTYGKALQEIKKDPDLYRLYRLDQLARRAKEKAISWQEVLDFLKN